MLIKKLNDSTFDVFWNKGWESCARFKRAVDGKIQFITGKVMPTKLFQQFRSILDKKNKTKQIKAAHHVGKTKKDKAKKQDAALLARYQK